MKNFFIKIGRWFKNHAPTKRRLIQIYSALLFNANIKGYFGSGTNVIYTGSTKYLCTPGLNCYSCPGAVTACPLGALQNAFASSKTRAPYYMLGIIGLLGLMLARTICGFLCPTGLGQDLLYKIRTPKLKKSRYTRILSYFKYVLLAVCVIAIPIIYQGIPAFCKYICPAGTFGGSLALLSNPNNADFFGMLRNLFTWKFVLLVGFVVASIFVYRFFCRFFCPLGAILGFFNSLALIGVTYDKSKCTECGLCVSVCKMDVKHVGDHECINCGACMKVCPTKAITWKGSKLFVGDKETATTTEFALAANEGMTQTAIEEKPIIFSAQNAGVASQNETCVKIPDAQDIAPTTPTERLETSGGGKDTIPAKQTKNKTEKTVEEKKLKKSFWLQFSAWAAAMVLLVTALVYFNFFAGRVTVEAASYCPEFTVTAFDTTGARETGKPFEYDENSNYLSTFSTSDYLGKKVMVINFWYTTCDPCVEELPHFEQVKEDYGDEIVMVAIHAPGMTSERKIQEFIDSDDPAHNKASWSEWQIIFALDTTDTDLFGRLGGKGAYPVTVVIDLDGNVSSTRQGKTSADVLRGDIDKALSSAR